MNGAPGQLNTVVTDGDRVELDGSLVGAQALRTVLLHKPAGVVTTMRDPQRRPTVAQLVDVGARVVPVGRLDVETTGALLLTNDGELANRLAHPRYGVEKTYVADVEGAPTDAVLRELAAGVSLEDGRTAPARVRRLGRLRIELVLHEGRNRQVRRMCEAVGHPVKRLHRPVYAGLGLEGLEAGDARELTSEELRRVRGLVGL